MISRIIYLIIPENNHWSVAKNLLVRWLRRKLIRNIGLPWRYKGIAESIVAADGAGGWARTLRSQDRDQLLGRFDFASGESNPRPLVYLTDRQNSMLGIVDSQGVLVKRLKYDTYGRVSLSNVPSAYADIVDNYTYTGHFLDPNSQLLNNRGRFYDPAAGRWLGPAPQGWSTDPNKYRYGGDNPANHDPDADFEPAFGDYFMAAVTGAPVMPGTWDRVWGFVESTWDNIGSDRFYGALDTYIPGAQWFRTTVLGQSQYDNFNEYAAGGRAILAADRAVFGDQRTGWLAQTSNFSAGMGDTISGGLTRRIRGGLGYDDVVDYHSAAYGYGTNAGQVVNIALMVANPMAAAGLARFGVTGLNLMSASESLIGAGEAAVRGDFGAAALGVGNAGLSMLRGVGSICQTVTLHFKIGQGVAPKNQPVPRLVNSASESPLGQGAWHHALTISAGRRDVFDAFVGFSSPSVADSGASPLFPAPVLWLRR